MWDARKTIVPFAARAGVNCLIIISYPEKRQRTKSRNFGKNFEKRALLWGTSELVEWDKFFTWLI